MPNMLCIMTMRVIPTPQSQSACVGVPRIENESSPSKSLAQAHHHYKDAMQTIQHNFNQHGKIVLSGVHTQFSYMRTLCKRVQAFTKHIHVAHAVARCVVRSKKKHPRGVQSGPNRVERRVESNPRDLVLFRSAPSSVA